MGTGNVNRIPVPLLFQSPTGRLNGDALTSLLGLPRFEQPTRAA